MSSLAAYVPVNFAMQGFLYLLKLEVVTEGAENSFALAGQSPNNVLIRTSALAPKKVALFDDDPVGAYCKNLAIKAMNNKKPFVVYFDTGSASRSYIDGASMNTARVTYCVEDFGINRYSTTFQKMTRVRHISGNQVQISYQPRSPVTGEAVEDVITSESVDKSASTYAACLQVFKASIASSLKGRFLTAKFNDDLYKMTGAETHLLGCKLAD